MPTHQTERFRKKEKKKTFVARETLFKMILRQRRYEYTENEDPITRNNTDSLRTQTKP